MPVEMIAFCLNGGSTLRFELLRPALKYVSKQVVNAVLGLKCTSQLPYICEENYVLL